MAALVTPALCGEVSCSPDLALALGPAVLGRGHSGVAAALCFRQRQGPWDAPSRHFCAAQARGSREHLRPPPARTLSCHRVPFWGQEPGSGSVASSWLFPWACLEKATFRTLPSRPEGSRCSPASSASPSRMKSGTPVQRPRPRRRDGAGADCRVLSATSALRPGSSLLPSS